MNVKSVRAENMKKSNNLKNKIMGELLVTFLGGAIGGLIYAIGCSLEEKRKNK